MILILLPNFCNDTSLTGHEKLFEAKYARLPESDCKKQVKGCAGDQTTHIEYLFYAFDKCGQLVVIHQHAESKVNPAGHLKLSWLGPHLN